MLMDAIINFTRPGKGVMHYVEGLVDDNSIRLKTLTCLSPGFSKKWCEDVWWQNGLIPPGILIGSVVKFLFYKEWFSVMQLVGTYENHLGYYVDLDTPMQKVGNEYFLTDLFLDLWIGPDGEFRELDRDEFEQGFKIGLLTPNQYKQTNRVCESLKREITSGEFFQRIH
ncbi:MAG: hypothetical protein A2Y88_06510 [Chloroflexi bacterium RBG_13_48_10]|nr:MAG: hypothetical protein A2Y88_06510 [Chloroflexi bacterium RBG_13_48_10]